MITRAFDVRFRRPVLLRAASQSTELREDIQRQNQGDGRQRRGHGPEAQHRRSAVTIPTELDDGGAIQRALGHERALPSS